MQFSKSVVGALIFAVEIIFPGVRVVYGQNYPTKAIRMITGGTGGANDFTGRLIAQGLTVSLGQPVVVENRATVFIAAETVAKAPADGYTLLLTGGSHWIVPLFEKVSYDPIKEFSPITALVSMPQILVVHPSLPVKSVKELIALAKTKPGELNSASAPVGTIPHLALELFKSMAGVKIVGVPYKGTGPALNALIAGQVQLMFASAPSAAPHIKSNRLRALAITSAQASTLFPGLPAVAFSGVPGYEAVSTIAVFAPAKTPTALIMRINQEMVRILNQSDIKSKLSNVGSEPVGNSPEQFAVSMKSEMDRMGKIISEGAIRAE